MTTTVQDTLATLTPEVSFEIVTVTPDMARDWLERNVHNRNVSEARVTQFKRDILADAWYMTGEAIKFDRNGNVLDGQHRLWAVVEAEKSIDTLVVTGLAPETQEVMDTGQKRTMGQVLGLRGISNPNLVAGAAVMMYQWVNADKFKYANSVTGRAITHTEISQVLKDNPDMEDAIAFSQARNIPGLTSTVRGFVLTLLRKVDKEAADKFFADLSSHNTQGYGDPKAALLRRLASAAQNNERIDRYTQAIVLIRVWNAVRRGEEMARIITRYRNEPVDAEEPI